MSQSNYTFEDYLYFIENELGISMLYWQKECLRMIYENKPYDIPGGRGCGRTVFKKAAKLLEELKKENQL